jgi:hypothetical protein
MTRCYSIHSERDSRDLSHFPQRSNAKAWAILVAQFRIRWIGLCHSTCICPERGSGDLTYSLITITDAWYNSCRPVICIGLDIQTEQGSRDLILLSTYFISLDISCRPLIWMSQHPSKQGSRDLILLTTSNSFDISCRPLIWMSQHPSHRDSRDLTYSQITIYRSWDNSCRPVIWIDRCQSQHPSWARFSRSLDFVR